MIESNSAAFLLQCDVNAIIVLSRDGIVHKLHDEKSSAHLIPITSVNR